ncbi:MAG: arginine deiminase family protein [Pseudomonadota bacterium]
MTTASSSARWSIDSEYGPLREVLLSRPDNYQWIATNSIAERTLGAGTGLDHQKLQAQYRELEDALTGAGVTLHYTDSEAHLPYQVYTRDSSQITPWGPVLTQLFRPQRRGEYHSLLKFYGGLDGIWNFSTKGTLEGGDIHIIRPGLCVVGHSGERTDEAGAAQFAGWLRDEGWEVRLQPFDDYFLHLDLLFSAIGDGVALACHTVLDQGFVDWLTAHGIRTIDVGYREAVHHMGCNVLALGNDRIVSPKHCQAVNDKLRAEGFTVLDPELELFAMGGGSVHCMTMPLKRDSLA